MRKNTIQAHIAIFLQKAVFNRGPQTLRFSWVKPWTTTSSGSWLNDEVYKYIFFKISNKKSIKRLTFEKIFVLKLNLKEIHCYASTPNPHV